METKKSISVIIAGFILLLGSLTSCRKEAPTLAKIYVHDINGNAFSGADVRLYGEPSSSLPHNAVIIDETQFSDATGQVIFDYSNYFKLGQAGFAVLNIEVSSGDTLFGSGIIKVEEEKINQETVIIQPL